MDELKILLGTMIDKSSLTNIQKQLAKEKISMNVDLNFAKALKESKDDIKKLSKQFGEMFNLSDREALSFTKEYISKSTQLIKEETRAQESLVNAMSKGREASELAYQAEKKRQELAQSNAINKATDQEYASKQKLVDQMASMREKSELAAKAEQKRQDLAQANASNKALDQQYRQSSIEAEKVAISASKINQVIASGGNEAKIEQLTAKFRSLGLSTEEIQKRLLGVSNAFNALKGSSDNASLITNAKLLDSEYEKVNNRIKQTTVSLSGLTTESQRLTKLNSIKTYADNNSKAAKALKNDFAQMYAQLNNPNLTVSGLKAVDAQFKSLQIRAREAGLMGKTLGDTFSASAKKFGQWVLASVSIMTAIRSVQRMISSVIELDTSLVDLKKTTNATSKQLENFYYTSNETAKQLGITTKEIISATSAWSRLGYSIEEATTLAKNSAILKSISPDLDISKATDGLVSSLKAFKIEANDSLDGIISKINIIGNTQAVDNGDIVDILTRSSSAMAEANNTLEQTIALGTAATEITRDADATGTALKTISMRLRGYDEETESYTNNVEGLTGTIADLTKTASTPGGISLFTDKDKQTYKSTYQLLEDISKVYNKLSDKNQAELLEAIAGKRQGQIAAAMISNFSAAQKSMDSMENSAGNAMQEMNVIYDSIEYRLNKLSQTGVGISQNLFNRDDMKAVIDLVTKLAEAFDFVTDKLGLFGTVLTGVGIGSFVKNFGSIKTWVSELGKVQAVINSIGAQSVLVNAGTGLLTTNSLNALSVSVSGLSEKQALLALSTKNLTAEQTNQVLVEAGIIASNEKISAGIVQRVLTGTTLDAEQKSAILTTLGLVDANTGLIISTASCTKEELTRALATQGLVGTNAEAITSTLGLTTANNTATASFGLLGNSIKSMLLTNPIGWIILIGTAIYGTVKAVDYFSDSVEEVKERVGDLMSSYNSAIDAANTNAQKTEGLVSQYEKLSKGVNNLGENVSLTTDEYSKYHNVVSEIADMFPELITGYDNQGNAILSLKGNVDQLRDAYKSAQDEAYNLLITSGKSSDGNDIITDYKNESRDETWLEKTSSFFGNTSTTDAIDSLQQLLNATSGSVQDFKDLYNQLYEIYGDDFDKIGNAIDTSNWASLTKDDIQAMTATIKSNIQTLQSEINSSLSNVKTLANAYLMTNSDYAKLDEQSKNAASIIVNGLNEGVANEFESKEDVGVYVQKIVDTITNNPEAKNAMIGLFTLDYSDMPIDEANAAINQYINYIAQVLGEDPVELKIRLGFDSVDELEKKYNNAISEAQEKFGKDETGFFKTNSVNTKEEVDKWIEIANSANTAAEAEKKYLEQGTVNQSNFTTNFSDLPVDKLEEYISLLNSGDINESTISTYSDLNELIKESGISAEDAVKSIKDYAEGFTSSTDLISNIQSAYDLLKATTEEYQKNGQIGLSSLESIANQYPELRSAVNSYVQGLISADDVMAQLQTAYDDDANAFRTAMAYKMSGNEDFFTKIKDNNQGLFTALAGAYGDDVLNWKTLAQAKADIDKSLISQLADMWGKYYGSFDANVVKGKDGQYSLESDDPTAIYESGYQAIEEEIAKRNQMVRALNEAANVEITIPNFNGIGSVDSKSDSKEKTKKDFSEVFDWISTTIDRVNEKVEKLQDQISNASNWKVKNSLTDTTIDAMSDKLTALQSQADTYQKEADKYAKNLNGSYLDKIKNGTLEVETITDEVIANNVKSYQEWYDKAEDVKNEIDDVKKSMQELAESKLDNIISDFDSLTSLMEKYSSYSESLISLQKDLGEEITNADYEQLIDQQKGIYNELQNKYSSLSSELAKAVSKGTVQVGTEEWRKYNEELIDVNSSMNDAVSSMNDFRQSLIDLPFEELQTVSDELDRINNGYDTMLDLIGDSGLTDKGMITTKGLAKIALYGQQYANAKQEAAEYANAINALNEMYDNGSLTQSEYNEKLNEYTSAQNSAVQATKEAEDAILQFRKDAIQEQIDDMDELIAKKKESKQEDYDYASYLDELAEKQKTISNIQKKLNELTTNSDPEDSYARSQRIQLQKDLADAQKDLDKTQADHSLEEQLKALEQEGENYKNAKNNELDELENNYDKQQKVISDYLSDVKNNYSTVYKTLTEYGENYNLATTDDLTSPWESASSAVDTFQSAVGDAIAQINIDIANIDLSSLTELVSMMQGVSGGSSGSGFEDVTGSGTWQKTSKGDWYGSSNDDYVSDGIYTIGGKQYSFNEDGYMKTGWDDSTDSWRYFDPENGQMVKSTWRDYKGKSYYLKSDGTMAADMAIKAKNGSGYYYVDDEGTWDGNTLSYDEVKRRDIEVGYASGTDDAKSGLKYVGEDEEEFIFTPHGTVLSSNGHEVIFNGGETTTLRDMMANPNGYIMDTLMSSLPTLDTTKIMPNNNGVSLNITSPLVTIEGGLDSTMKDYVTDLVNGIPGKIVDQMNSAYKTKGTQR